MKLKNKLVLTGAATLAALFLDLNASAATDNRPVLDLSEWQGYITDTQANLLKGEVKGVILRVQYGSNYKDKVFDNNAAVLKKAGVKFGVYAYERYVSTPDARVEAMDFYNRAKKYGPLFYANDAEMVSTYSGNSYSAATKAFANKLRSLSKKPVYLYTGQSIYWNYLKSRTGYDGVWLANYQSRQPVTGFKFELWQYTDCQYSTSIRKSVDTSKFVTADNWFGKTINKSQYPDGGYRVGDTVRINNNITYYGTTTKADNSLSRTNLTVKTVRTVYTGRSNQVLTVYHGSKVIGQVRAQDVTKVGSAVKKNDTSVNWVRESKAYTLKNAVQLRTGASRTSRVITTLPTGTTIKTDQAIIKGGYRWVRQPRSGGYGYLATGPMTNTLKYVKSGTGHTYYMVKTGDSWWKIANNNGLNVYTLASKNGKSISTTIYPGQRLLIK